MFPYNKDNKQPEEYSLTFIAGFHLGIPLAICQTRESTGWIEVRKELSESFSKESAPFELLSVDYEPETNFPLGKPVTIRFLKFFEVFNFKQFLQDEGLLLPPNQYKFDSLIWICPSGVVLVIGRIYCYQNRCISLSQFENIVEKHYAELAYVFTEVAKVILSLLPEDLSSISFCCTSDIQKCKNALDIRKEFSASGSMIFRHLNGQQMFIG